MIPLIICDFDVKTNPFSAVSSHTVTSLSLSVLPVKQLELGLISCLGDKVNDLCKWSNTST